MRLTLTTPERQVEINLEDATLEPLLEELRIVSPLLAAKIEDADAGTGSLQLKAEELEYLATAANLVDKGGRVDDPGLRLLSKL